MEFTRKELYERYGKNFILQIGYLDLQSLLKYETRIGYTRGIYGLNASIYDIGDGFFIATGPRAFGHEVPYDIVRKYEKLATNDRKKNLDLISQFLCEVRDYWNRGKK